MAGDGSIMRVVLTGLIGAPIRSSASPAMHEAAAQALGFRCHYQLVEVADADRDALRLMLEGVRRLGFAGVNVTYPYKEAIVPLLDELAPGAAAIGAVNTVVVNDGRLVGHNTDFSGFTNACGSVIGRPIEQPVALIGAGGVGRAIGFALAELGTPEIRIYDRDSQRAGALAGALGARTKATPCGSAQEAISGAGGIVNATPVGMFPSHESSVPEECLSADRWVADAVYTPLNTPLLLAARALGARVMTGRELAIHQGADAFRLFTGTEPSRDVMGEAFDAVMARRAAEQEAA
jgi:shikimate dehydrogenase